MEVGREGGKKRRAREILEGERRRRVVSFALEAIFSRWFFGGLILDIVFEQNPLLKTEW